MNARLPVIQVATSSQPHEVFGRWGVPCCIAYGAECARRVATRRSLHADGYAFVVDDQGDHVAHFRAGAAEDGCSDDCQGDA